MSEWMDNAAETARLLRGSQPAADTAEIVRRRLADGRTIADADVHRLVAEIDRLRAEESTCSTACIAERQAAGFCGEAEEAHAEIARLRAALLSLAPYHQGSGSQAGHIIAHALGIPFPLRSPYGQPHPR